MKMRHSLTFQLGIIIGCILVAMLAITSVANYKTAYDKLYDAAGVEAYGCANITTGLISPKDMELALGGDTAIQDKIGSELNWTTEHKNIFETQYILTLTGEIVALDDNLKEKGFSVGDPFHIDEEAISMMIDMNHPTYSKAYDFGGMKRLSGYAPIYKDHDPSQEIIAVSVIDFDASIVSERTWDVVRNGIFISILPMLIAAAITVWLIRRKTAPLTALRQQAGEVAEGDLTAEGKLVNRHDEVGELSKAIHTMTMNLRAMIGTIQQSSGKLIENAAVTTRTVKEMEGASQMVADSMNEVAANVSDSTEHAGFASELLHSLSEDLSAAKNMADHTAENSEKTYKIAQEGEQLAVKISDDMGQIRKSAADVNKEIKELFTAAEKIQTITASIAGIAAQTNLLALNASIEAARAGEHGRGFAVVADEVRNLSEQSNEEVLQVENLIKDITEKIEKVVRSTEESTGAVETGTATAERTAGSLRNIASAVYETAEEIKEISSLIGSESEKSEVVVKRIEELVFFIRQIEDKTNNVSAATEETTASINDVAGQAAQVQSLSEELSRLVGEFKL